MASDESPRSDLSRGELAVERFRAEVMPELRWIRAEVTALKQAVTKQNGRVDDLEARNDREDGRREGRAEVGFTARTWFGLLLSMAGVAAATAGVVVAIVLGAS